MCRMKSYIYLVFSATPYKIGKAIRKITGEKFNHASIALDSELSEMYSFARRFYRAPFLGGFVRESHARFYIEGAASTIQVCRLEVTQAQYDFISKQLRRMYDDRQHYLYNHLSAAITPFGRLLKISDSYICTEFIVEQLIMLGYPLDTKKYYSADTLLQMFESSTVYTGPMPQPKAADDEYFSPTPTPKFATLHSFTQLLRRLGRLQNA